MILDAGSRVEHPTFGKGIIVEVGNEHYTIYFRNSESVKRIAKDFADLKIIDAIEGVIEMQVVVRQELEDVINAVLDRRADISELVKIGDRWKNGTLTLHPFDKSLQSKEIPLETFFHKIVMVRDRLRVLKAQINAHKQLSDAEKVDLQQYITRCYGSLTTFNVLFKDDADFFKGQSSK